MKQKKQLQNWHLDIPTKGEGSNNFKRVKMEGTCDNECRMFVYTPYNYRYHFQNLEELTTEIFCKVPNFF